MLKFPDDFTTDPGFDPAEDYIGPFYHGRDERGPLYAFEAGETHCNAHGIVHGGVLMTFADYALCMAATDGYEGESCVTVSFTSEFVAAASIGAVVTCRTHVTRKTRSMGFVRGEVYVGDDVVMTCGAVVKRIVDKES
ncbi:MAG: PaaI family thioesterase [Gammaproteobacteria bacterium]|nr:PaaI family thioesterase [Gammaproteobacteria bacterium]